MIFSKNRKGFTLVELLVTIAIIAILAAIAVPVISGLIKRGNDTTEDVNAVMYTSIMNRFASANVEDTSSYPRLRTTGYDNEYALFSSKAGKGTFPGFNILAGATNADVLTKIRKEAVIAIKAFSDTAVSDDYFIAPPMDDEYEYVYYYLTGEVKKMKRAELNITSAADYLNGVIDVKDYWVYLSRDGGSGAALGGVSNGTGHLFIKVKQFGTGQALGDALVTVTSGATVFSARTTESNGGIVGFSGVPEGTVQISVSMHGAVSFPDREFYDKSGEVYISASGYEGCQMNAPYIVDLKLGSLGSLGYYEETKTWTGSDWTTSRQKITSNTTATSSFTANTSNPGGTPRSESYTSNLRDTGGTQQLLIGSKFLTYGNYSLAVSSYGYRTYRENIKAGVYGIDNSSGRYTGASAPYEYPVIMLYPSGQSVVSGEIEAESSHQPLSGTPSGLVGSWVYTNNNTVRARVRMQNQSTGTNYYSAYLTLNSNGKYGYSVSGLPDGTYSFHIDSPYGFGDMTNFPSTVTVDGRHIVVSGKILKQDAAQGSLTATITYDNVGNYDPIPNALVTLRRLGDVGSLASSTSTEGAVTLRNQRCGFYQLTITLPDSLGGSRYNYKLFIFGDNSCVIRLPVSTVTITGKITPYSSSTAKQTKKGTLSNLTVVLERYDSGGAVKYSNVSATVNATDVVATYSVSVVPGYYKIKLTAKCYLSITDTLQNFKLSSTRDLNMTVDSGNKDNHVGFSMLSDATNHWNECSNCGLKLDAAKHTPSAWKKYSSDYCYRECTVCNYRVDDLKAHDMKSSVTKAATCTADGVKTHTCSRGCGYSYTSVISKTGHAGNGVWVYDNNNTHHQNCKNCGTTVNSGSACSRGGLISNGDNHYDKCSKCGGKRYSNHTWSETSRSGYTCTGGTIYYKCSGCGATTTGSYGASASHNFRARCSVKHSCSWKSYCTAGGNHVWNGYYHILCTMCGASDDSKWCAMHCASNLAVKTCPF